MAGDFASTVKPHLEKKLSSGESLQGVIAATHQTFFSGSLYAIGVTQRRLLLQELDRKLAPKGEPLVITPETLASAAADGAGEGYLSVSAAIMDLAAISLTLRTTDGKKMKFMMMKGGNDLQALADWLRRMPDPISR